MTFNVLEFKNKLWNYFNFRSDWACLITSLCEDLFSHNSISLMKNGILASKWDIFMFAVPIGMNPSLISSPTPMGLKPAYVNKLIPHPTHEA